VTPLFKKNLSKHHHHQRDIWVIIDHRLASLALLYEPVNVAVDASENLYVIDFGNNVIRMMLQKTGVITTIAGNGLLGFSGDNGQF
jgi:hypothetical protein